MKPFTLNEATDRYQPFFGKPTETMRYLINQGLSPMTVAQLMQRRLDVLVKQGDLSCTWWDYTFQTTDAIAYNYDGRVKIVLDSQLAKNINDDSHIEDGALILSRDLYSQLDAPEFSKNTVKKYSGKTSTSVEEVVSNPFWQALAGDQILLREYATAVFKETERWCRHKNMAVYISRATGTPSMKIWALRGVGLTSPVEATFPLDDAIMGANLMVGRKNTPELTAPTLDQIMSITSKYVTQVNIDTLRNELTRLYRG